MEKKSENICEEKGKKQKQKKKKNKKEE